eukprot:3682957-Rhodomonas_salina.2
MPGTSRQQTVPAQDSIASGPAISLGIAILQYRTVRRARVGGYRRKAHRLALQGCSAMGDMRRSRLVAA